MRNSGDLAQIAEETERVKARNRIAAKVFENVRLKDLYGLVEQHQEYFSADGVHFNEKGREVQAKQVADAVLSCFAEAAHTEVRADTTVENRRCLKC